MQKEVESGEAKANFLGMALWGWGVCLPALPVVTPMIISANVAVWQEIGLLLIWANELVILDLWADGQGRIIHCAGCTMGEKISWVRV